ncbi:MAG TPA: GldG family protein, partial [bacterium]
MRKILSYGALVGLVLILTGIGRYGITKMWKPFSWITVLLGAALVVLYAVWNLDALKRTLSLRSVRYGGNALAAALILLLILGGLNFIANRHTLRIDFTAGKQFSLSEQSKSILKNLKKDVRATAFYQDARQGSMESLLKSYRAVSPRFHFEFVDPDKKPAMAKQYGITAYNTTVLECSGNTERVTAQQEQDITNALIKVTRNAKKVVYFVQGHGESDIDDTERGGFSAAKKGVEQESYDVRKLNLAEKKSVPSDCAILIVNGPQKSFFAFELDSIQKYLERGGKALFMIDPEV